MPKKVTQKTQPATWRNRITGHDLVDADQLLANPKNWRIHPQNQQSALSEVLDKVGWVQDVIVNQRTGFVVDGHLRVSLAISKGEKVPVVYVDLTPEEEALVLASIDPLSAMAGTDSEKLAELVAELTIEPGALADMLGGLDVGGSKPGLTDDDAVPEPQEAVVTTLGDCWRLGAHRLVCGDSTDIGCVERLMGGEKADMVFTDPPYNADYSSRVDKQRRKPLGGIMNDAMSPEQYDGFLSEVVNTLAATTKTQAAVYCCIDWKRYPQVAEAFGRAFNHKATIIWDKRHFGLGSYYRTQYEMVLFGVVGDQVGVWNAGHDERDVWSMSREVTGDYVHPTQKPVELIERALKNTSRGEDAILDLFGGSGSTLIACEKTGRAARLMELDPKYCDVIVRRWQDYTGQQATLDGTDRTFDEIAAERQPVAA